VPMTVGQRRGLTYSGLTRTRPRNKRPKLPATLRLRAPCQASELSPGLPVLSAMTAGLTGLFSVASR
jgi:hypothetical protein